jgi:hypothetical protein
MKSLVKIQALLAALLMTTFVNCHAQKPANAETAISEIAKKYEGNKEVNCMTVVKGGGLEMLKLMLNKEFGKKFMKGVTSITIIEYSKADAQTCTSLRKDLNVFKSILQEVDISKEKEFTEETDIRCFASLSDSKTISDFVVGLENDKIKMIMHLAGTINIE